ncbi:3-keto-disaccharide hydrolase [Singulisphaera rosea]
MRIIGCVAGMLFMLVGLTAGGAEPPAYARVEPDAKASETIRLFDGKDLEGWEGHKQYWSVEAGEVVGRNLEGVGVSTYLLTKRTFSDFRLIAKVKRVKSGMHSGIAFWGRMAPEHGDPYTYAGHLVMFPSPWGMFDLYGRKLLPVDPAPAVRVGKPRDWNSLEILALGHRVQVALNGTQVVDWSDPEPGRIKAGPIGLQLHANNVAQEVRFKDLTLITNPKLDRLITIGR